MNNYPNNSDWFVDFFSGPTLNVWRDAISPEQTAEEVSFIENVLSLPSGAQILDLPCGNGRLSWPFSQRGYRITGVDLCEQYIQEAESRSDKKSKSISTTNKPVFLKADMRRFVSAVAHGAEFAGAFCMGNSLGYFNRIGTTQFFKEVAACLKSGARFIIDSSMVAECFLINGGQREWVQVGELFMLTENQYCLEESYVKTTYTYLHAPDAAPGAIKGPTQGIAQRTAVHWIYTVGEVSHLLSEAGFSVESMYSSCDFTSFELGADRLLLVARKD